MNERPADFISELAASRWETRELILDNHRETAQPDDSPLQTAARKYLKSRSGRIRIEREFGSKIDAFPRRLIEVMRAHKLTRIGEFEFESKEDRDYWLPTYARTLVDKTPGLPEPK